MTYNAGTFVGLQSLPQNFVSNVIQGMRLPQPQPQFFFAMMALSAAAMGMAIEEGGSAENFVKLLREGGGNMPDTGLDRFIRTAEAYPDAVLYVNGFGKNAGDTVKMRRPVYTGGGYDEASREVKPQIATSLQGQSIQMEEVPVVLKQFEGPWDSTNGRVGPYQINEFDARYRRNADNLAGETVNHLMYDYVKWLDSVVMKRFQSAKNITYADGVANIQAMTAGAGHAINLDALLQARKSLSDRERAPFQGGQGAGRYMAIVPTLFNVDIAKDPAFRQLAANPVDTGKNVLFRFIRSVEDLDIFEATTLPTYAAGATVPGDSSGTVPSGSTLYEAMVIGPHAVGFGRADAPTMHTTSDTDYGKNVKVIWRSIEAFQLLDDRGVQRVVFQAAG